MNVILSNVYTNEQYDTFIVVNKFKDVRQISNGIDTLIIHSFDEPVFDAGIFINEFKNKGIKRFIYINNEPKETIKMCLQGCKNSYVYDDEFYLEDEEELSVLLEDLDELQNSNNETTALATKNINILEDFIESFKNKENKINAPIYVTRVKEAINELSVITQKQELQINTMGTESLEIFAKAQDIIKQMNDQNRKVKQQLDALEHADMTFRGNGRAPMANSVDFFSSFRYMGSTPTLVIREFAPCRYLTSFIMAYVHHLHYTKNKRVKLIICHSKAANVCAKYSSFTTLSETSYHSKSLYDSEMIALSIPKKEVLAELLNTKNDVFIILDRLYNSNPIVTGRTVNINAVSGLSDISRHSLKPQDTIIPIIEPDNIFLTLNSIQHYPSEVDARYATYNAVYKDKFAEIDTKLKLR